LAANLRDQVLLADPRSAPERASAATTCVRKLGLEMPALVDSMANEVERAYSGWPDRLYVIGRDGRIVYKSSPGPFGFHPAAAEQALQRAIGAATPSPHSR
jgi:type I thyroxine 5'-deiodinase